MKADTAAFSPSFVAYCPTAAEVVLASPRAEIPRAKKVAVRNRITATVANLARMRRSSGSQSGQFASQRRWMEHLRVILYWPGAHCQRESPAPAGCFNCSLCLRGRVRVGASAGTRLFTLRPGPFPRRRRGPQICGLLGQLAQVLSDPVLK